MNTFKKSILLLLICIAPVTILMAQKNEADQQQKNFFHKEMQDLKSFLFHNQSFGDHEIREINTSSTFYPYWPDELKMYGVYCCFNMDPTPPPIRFIVLPDSSIYNSSDISQALSKLNVKIQSQEKASNIASMIIHVIDDDDYSLFDNNMIYGFDKNHWSYKNYIKVVPEKIRKQVKQVRIIKKKSFYRVIIFVHHYHRTHPRINQTENSLLKKTLKICSGFFSVEKEEVIWSQ